MSPVTDAVDLGAANRHVLELAKQQSCELHTARELPTARTDGERILNWTQFYHLEHLPEKLIVVGSGVTGAELASAYRAPTQPLVRPRARVRAHGAIPRRVRVQVRSAHTSSRAVS